jgi:Protein of unknown function (DUF2726)
MLKKLSNFGEDSVYRRLAPVADKYAAQVFRKIRVADVIDINWVDQKFRSYALMAHFDFVVADSSHTPQFAVEFDGPGHSTNNDVKKDTICNEAGLALFRVNLPTFRKQIGLLSFLDYLVHLWFLSQEFRRMQEEGEVDYDEPFTIGGFLKVDAKHIFDSEFNLLSPARARLNKFCKSNNLGDGIISHLSVSELLMRNKVGEFIAFCSFPVEQGKLYGRATIGLKIPCLGKLAEVPFSNQEIGQFCTALAIDDLVEQLTMYSSGEMHMVRHQEDVRDEITTLRKLDFGMLLAFGSDSDFQYLA